MIDNLTMARSKRKTILSQRNLPKRSSKKRKEEDEDYEAPQEEEEEEELVQDPKAKAPKQDDKSKEIAELKAALAVAKTSQATKPITQAELTSTQAGRDLFTALNKSLQRNWWGKQPFINNEGSLTRLCSTIYLVLEIHMIWNI